MARCFCGCGQTVPRFPLGIRSINTRGKQLVKRIDKIEKILASLPSPTAEAMVKEGSEHWVPELASGVHALRDPGADVEAGIRDWQARARRITPGMVGKRVRQMGTSPEEAAMAIRAGQFDPFAE